MSMAVVASRVRLLVHGEWVVEYVSICWQRRILKGNCHEIEMLTPVVQPCLVMPWLSHVVGW